MSQMCLDFESGIFVEESLETWEEKRSEWMRSFGGGAACWDVLESGRVVKGVRLVNGSCGVGGWGGVNRKSKQ